MQMFDKKRLEIFIEVPALHRLEALLDEMKLPGYTVMPVLGGSGDSGDWTRDGLVSTAGGMVAVICIVGADELDHVMDRIFMLVSRQIGIVNVTNCQVIRTEKF